MQTTWIKKTLSLILTLALAFSAFAMLPAGALAVTGEYQLTANPASATVNEGESITFTVEQVDPAATSVTPIAKYEWSDGYGNGSGVTTGSYTFTPSGSGEVTCALYDTVDAVDPFDTLRATYTRNAAAPAPAPAPAPAGDPAGVPSVALAPSTGGNFAISNDPASPITADLLASGRTLGINNVTGKDLGTISWTSSDPTVLNFNGYPTATGTSPTLTLGSVGTGLTKITATSSALSESASFDIRVNPYISVSPKTIASMAVDETQTLTVTIYPKNASVQFDSSAPTVVDFNGANSRTVQANNGTATVTVRGVSISSGATTITAKYVGDDSFKDTCSITTVTGKAPTLNWTQSSIDVTVGSAARTINLRDNYLSYTPDIKNVLTFSLDADGGNPTATLNTATGELVLPANAKGTLQVSVVSASVGKYAAVTTKRTITIYAGTTAAITTSPSYLRLGINSSGIIAIGKTPGSGDWDTPVSSNSAVAEATIATPTANDTVLRVNSYQTGTATITLRVKGSSSYATVYVTVGTPTNAISVSFLSCDDCTTTLTRYYNYGTLTITVSAYNPAQPYVTVSRSNIRTYVRDGSYTSHPSSLNYTAQLYPNADGTATAIMYVIPQYNGNTYYTASYTYSSAYTPITAKSPTIYVTGFSTLPQTGPDYTWAYVLGGLCLAAVATAITLNVKRKKKQDN